MRLLASATVDQIIRVLFGTLAKDGYVYFVQASIKDGPVKIGYSKVPRLRMSALRGENGIELDVLGMFHGNFSDEQHLHRVFVKDHLHHEWFKPSTRLLDLASRGNVVWDEMLGSQPLICLLIVRDAGKVLVVDAHRHQDIYFRGDSAAAAQDFVMVADRSPRDSVIRYAALMQASADFDERVA